MPGKQPMLKLGNGLACVHLVVHHYFPESKIFFVSLTNLQRRATEPIQGVA